MVEIKKIKILIFFLLICTLSSCSVFTGNKTNFDNVITKHKINFLTYKDVIYEKNNVNSWLGDSSGYVYYFCKLDKNILDEWEDYDEQNQVFEGDLQAKLNSFIGYENIPDKYKVDFDRKYYYSSDPIIYYPLENELILIDFVLTDHSKDEYVNEFKTKKRRLETYMEKTGLYGFLKGDLSYLLALDNNNEIELDYFYFTFDEYPKDLFDKANSMFSMYLTSGDKLKDSITAKTNNYIENYFDYIDDKYKLDFSKECYYSETFNLIFYPDNNVFVVIDIYQKYL